MTVESSYVPLTVETLGDRLGDIAAIVEQVGGSARDWSVTEVGDGNLNLVFVVTGSRGTVIVKQALPYVRLVGDSWPLPLYRAYFEHEALVRQAVRDPGMVPEIHHFDRDQALIVMEYFTPHLILREKLIRGEYVEALGQRLGLFCARTAFRGSELSMASADKKSDVGLFSGNVAIPAITEALVFTDPYFEAEMNHHTEELAPVVARLRADVDLKARAQAMLMKFASNTETMVHGDLHSGSVMATATDCRVIDPEFVQYGPMGFDIGMLTANYLMAYFSQPGHRDAADLESYQSWILSVICDTFAAFDAEFRRLWATERTGMLFPACLFEEQGQSSEPACEALLRGIWHDALTICGIEMHRRVLSLAHNADFERIEDTGMRARLEARNLMMGANLVLNPQDVRDVAALTAMAGRYNKETVL